MLDSDGYLKIRRFVMRYVLPRQRFLSDTFWQTIPTIVGMKSILIKLIFLLSLLLPSLVTAHHGTKSQSYLEDATGLLDLKEVQQSKDWKPFEQVLMLGYKKVLCG